VASQLDRRTITRTEAHFLSDALFNEAQWNQQTFSIKDHVLNILDVVSHVKKEQRFKQQ